jgi:hypothetical protein
LENPGASGFGFDYKFAGTVTSELVIVTPEIAPGSGGVADHTLALLRYWRSIPNLTLLVANAAPVATESVSNGKQLEKTRDAILAQLPASGGKVLVQYSAYGFNRLGYPHDLLRALVDWKKRSGGRLVVMFHEIWAFWPFINKNFIVQHLHRRALKRLLQVCDAAFTTTASQAQHLRRLHHAASVQVLPVGSNIRRNKFGKVSRDEGSAALFGLQSSRVRALENMHKSLTTLAAAGKVKRIVCLGHDSDPEASAREHELLRQLNLAEGFAHLGGLAEEAVSDILATAYFGIFGQNELSCTKSGSFMAYAVHQLNVLAEFADTSKPPPLCWLVAPAELLSGVEPTELDRRAECLRMWQEQNCSWAVIANKLTRALAIESADHGS